jgi:hypothetical protein
MEASPRFKVTEVDALLGFAIEGDPLTTVQTLDPGMV